MRKLLLTLLLIIQFSVLFGQRSHCSVEKLSPYLRQLVISRQGTRAGDDAMITAFVKTRSGSSEILADGRCRIHAKLGDVYVVEMPCGLIPMLSMKEDIMRIEAGRSCTALLDTTSHCVNYDKVKGGIGIPRAYTGRGVVMGIMDVGFDFTSPNFYTRDMSRCRINRFWDMLSPERDSSLAVGRDYDANELIRLKHSADNLVISHGTHTLGIAAGSGYDSEYIGVACESDICLVNNAVIEDTILIAPEDRMKYTTATDALGFKYIFDYAESIGKPCVISFSEGSRQGFDQENALYYEAMNSLVGPGRIIVASAGNDGGMKLFMHKPAFSPSSGSFAYCPYNDAYFLLKSSSDFDLLIKSYGSEVPEEILIPSSYVVNAADSTYKIRKECSGAAYDITVAASKSAFDPDDTVYDLIISSTQQIGGSVPLSIQLCRSGAEVQMYNYNGIFLENNLDITLSDADYGHTVLTPGAASSVICVGATSYREGFVNYKGEYKTWNNGYGGEMAPYSATGPTFDGRIKPDVVAPGTNVISSYSSYYIEAKPDAFDTQSDVERYEYKGRTYSWNANTGTSMSSPVAGGIIALWLEADPDLTPDDVREIFASSCRRVNKGETIPNNVSGYGEIDAYKGLIRILGIDGIEGIENEARCFHLLSCSDGFVINFDNVLDTSANADVFAADGTAICSERITCGTKSHKINVRPGVYAVRMLIGGRYESQLVRVK